MKPIKVYLLILLCITLKFKVICYMYADWGELGNVIEATVQKTEQSELYSELINLIMYYKIYTYKALTLDPRRSRRGVSDIPPRRPRFTKMT
jgi:hypothetical protein